MHIILFAKAPVPGRVKTRLIPALGAQAAARLARRMLHHALEQAWQAAPQTLELCACPAAEDAAWQGVGLRPGRLNWTNQGDGDLGARMGRALQAATRHSERVLLIGSDCPALTAERIRAAAAALRDHDAVMIPASDGGYVLLGLKRYDRTLFDDIPWSSAAVAAVTAARMQQLGWSCARLQPLHDIDEPQDLQHLPTQWQFFRNEAN